MPGILLVDLRGELFAGLIGLFVGAVILGMACMVLMNRVAAAEGRYGHWRQSLQAET